MADSSEIDDALVARLAGDAELQTLLPDGVWFDLAPQGATKFLYLELGDNRDAVAQGRPGHRRVQEDCIYTVQACVQEPNAVAAAAAALRIDALLEDQPLALTAYRNTAIFRVSRIRKQASDEADAALRWQYRGGRYQVVVTPTDL
jgi:hypothetical protein